MTAIAEELSRKIDDLHADKQRLDVAKRRAEAHRRNEKAQRLVRRLEECDANIASLLAQAADCLDALVSATSDASGSQSSQRPMMRGGGGAKEEQEQLVAYEAQAQDWFATLNDVQLGLRSAVRNLQKVQQKPLATEVSTRTAGEGLAGASLGSAAKGHSLGLGWSAPVSAHGSRRNSASSVKTVGPGTTSSMTTDWHIQRPRRDVTEKDTTSNRGAHTNGSLLGAFVDVRHGQQVVQMRQDILTEESKLSLSSLRQQERSWQQLAGALSTVASEQSDALKRIGLQDVRTSAVKSDLLSLSTQVDPTDAVRQSHTHPTADVRLLRAILNLHMEVLPETTVTPVVAATSELP